MRLGVVSDTHDRASNVQRVIELFNRAAVDRVVHTGDVTSPSTLALFEALDAPLSLVLGNNDHDRDGLAVAAGALGARLGQRTLELSLQGRKLLVVHDPEEPEVTAEGEYDLILHGHTHRLRNEWRGSTLLLNPGESAGFVKGSNRCGIVDLATLGVELLSF